MFNYPYFNFPYSNKYSRYGYRYPYYNVKKEDTNISHNGVVMANPISSRAEMDSAPTEQQRIIILIKTKISIL